MAKWILKASIQKAISFLPYGHRINYLFQKHITKGVRLTDVLMDDKLIHLKAHLYYYKKYHTYQAGFATLEIGTGWYPIVPVGLYLAGADNIITVDLTPLLRIENLQIALAKFKEFHQLGKLKQYLPNILPDRLDNLLKLSEHKEDMNLEQLLKALNITYLVADARKLDLPSHSFDLINSNNTFEHIYPDILADILKEFKRLLKPDGVMSHFIDMSDHFAHLDSTINIYHFLKYTPAQWNLIDNSIQPQNRLRISDYRDIYAHHAIPILEEDNRPGDIAAVKSVKLAAPFATMLLENVAVSHSYIISRG